MPKIAVKQPAPPAEEVPVEIIANSLVSMADGIKALRAGPLNERALLLLIQHAMPATDRPSTKLIKGVLDGVEALKRTYLK